MLLTLNEVAKLLRVSNVTVRSHCIHGRLECLDLNLARTKKAAFRIKSTSIEALTGMQVKEDCSGKLYLAPKGNTDVL